MITLRKYQVDVTRAPDLYDTYQMHRTVMRMVNQGADGVSRADADVLHRLMPCASAPGTWDLLIQTNAARTPEPVKGVEICGEACVSETLDRIIRGSRVRVDVMAAIRGSHAPKDGEKRGRAFTVKTVPGAVDWWDRTTPRIGLSTDNDDEYGSPMLRVDPRGAVKGEKNGRPITHHPFLFSAICTVTDETLFANAVAKGIGTGKAFGFGLITVSLID